MFDPRHQLSALLSSVSQFSKSSEFNQPSAAVDGAKFVDLSA
jgi:hypothetical protein